MVKILLGSLILLEWFCLDIRNFCSGIENSFPRNVWPRPPYQILSSDNFDIRSDQRYAEFWILKSSFMVAVAHLLRLGNESFLFLFVCYWVLVAFLCLCFFPDFILFCWFVFILNFSYQFLLFSSNFILFILAFLALFSIYSIL